MHTNCYPALWPKGAKFALLLAAAVVAFSILLPTSAQAQTESVLYSFNYPTYYDVDFPLSCPPGALAPGSEQPHMGVLLHGGQVYGTTPEGGAGAKNVPDSDRGMVYRLTKPKSGGTPWNEQTLHSFQPEVIDGLYPCSRLLLGDSQGVLIGTTMGGVEGPGTIFELTPPAKGQTAWTETILYTFKGQSDGAWPFDGLTRGINGALYGVTRLGLNGINSPAVYEFANGQVTQLTNTTEIVYNGDLLYDTRSGSLFGTTQNGGKFGFGNVFQLTPPVGNGKWTMNDLYDFTGGSDGATPNGGLVGVPGDLFGTTQGGGNGFSCSNCGVLFELRQEIAGNPYTLIVQHAFLGQISNDGAVPSAGLYQDSTGTLWGTTTYGGELIIRHADLNFGTIFKLYPDPLIVHEWHYDLVYRFGGEPDGAYPQGRLTEDITGNVYGTTNAGGTANEGTVFQWKP